VSPSCGGTVNGEKDEDFYGCHLNKELIAGKPMLHFDTCKGDSGGPLYVQNAKGDWLLAGATSRGTDISSTMCGDGGTYVRVDAYAAWIKSVLDEGKPAVPRKPSARKKAKAKPKTAVKSKPRSKTKTASKPRPKSKAKAKAKKGKGR
jgi:secreted trypsin-like serine protease